MADDAASWLEGKRVAATGRCRSLSQPELAALITDHGGYWDRRLTRRTNLLIVGDSLLAAGVSQPAKCLETARRWRFAGHSLEILPERQFWGRLGDDGIAARIDRHSLGQLAEWADVSRDRVRAWMSEGLLEPTELRHRVAFFDYSQLQRARLIARLLEQGLALPEVASALNRLPPTGEATAPAPASLIADHRRLLVRDRRHRLVELTGQLWFDFASTEQADDEGRLAFANDDTDDTVDAWFEHGLELEDAGDFAAAAMAYRRAMEMEPNDAAIRFNLANALFMQDLLPDAVAAYLAAVERDPAFAEAWNNLGSVWALLDDHDRAMEAFRRALSLDAAYADALYNMADLLEALGRADRALPYWQQFLSLDRDSPWAQNARDRVLAGGTS